MAKPLDVLKKIGNVLEPIAPWLATAFGGPMAGAAVSRACQALNIVTKADATTDEKVSALDQAISNATLTPEQLVALKQADEQFQVDLQKAGFDHIEKLSALQYQDVADARQRETDLAKYGHPDNTARNLAYMVVGSCMGMSFWVLSGRFPLHDTAAVGLAGTVLGYLISEAKQVGGYYWGSSQGQDKATELLSQAPPVQK